MHWILSFSFTQLDKSHQNLFSSDYIMRGLTQFLICVAGPHFRTLSHLSVRFQLLQPVIYLSVTSLPLLSRNSTEYLHFLVSVNQIIVPGSTSCLDKIGALCSPVFSPSQWVTVPYCHNALFAEHPRDHEHITVLEFVVSWTVTIYLCVYFSIYSLLCTTDFWQKWSHKNFYLHKKYINKFGWTTQNEVSKYTYN
jgi:hypothetical protein